MVFRPEELTCGPSMLGVRLPDRREDKLFMLRCGDLVEIVSTNDDLPETYHLQH